MIIVALSIEMKTIQVIIPSVPQMPLCMTPSCLHFSIYLTQIVVNELTLVIKILQGIPPLRAILHLSMTPLCPH